MSIAGIPNNLYVQQGNSQVFLSWDISAGATTYTVQRSTDGVSFSTVASPAVPQYLDTSVTAGTQYWYQVASTNASGTSSYTAVQTIIPVAIGQMSLMQLRILSQQKADMENSGFITLPEWNTYINQSYTELYDILTTAFEKWYLKLPPYTFTTDGTSQTYALPSDFYKLDGVDLGLAGNSNAWVTLKRFPFSSRNRYVFPQVTSTYLGVFNARYDLVNNSLFFIPTLSSGQYIRVWYSPKPTWLLKDTDVLEGVSGWTEYVAVDAAIKALIKEESDPSALMAQKSALLKRIEEAASNRDEGEPESISDTRNRSESWGGYGPPNGDGAYGGY